MHRVGWPCTYRHGHRAALPSISSSLRASVRDMQTPHGSIHLDRVHCFDRPSIDYGGRDEKERRRIHFWSNSQVSRPLACLPAAFKGGNMYHVLEVRRRLTHITYLAEAHGRDVIYEPVPKERALGRRPKTNRRDAAVCRHTRLATNVPRIMMRPPSEERVI